MEGDLLSMLELLEAQRGGRGGGMCSLPGLQSVSLTCQ